MAPLHYLLVPDVQLLYAQGISRFLSQQLGVRVLINPPPKNTKIKVHYLIVIDRALSWKKAKMLFDWQRLVFIYSSPVFLMDFPFSAFKTNASLWGQQDLTPTTFKRFFRLLDSQAVIHSAQTLDYLNHPLAKLTEEDLRIFTLMAQGLHNEEIAEKLIRSKSTIERHKRYWKERLYMENQTDAGLITVLYRYGVIDVFGSKQ